MGARGWQVVSVLGMITLVTVIWLSIYKETHVRSQAMPAPGMVQAPSGAGPMMCPMRGMAHGMNCPCAMCAGRTGCGMMSPGGAEAARMPLIGDPAPAFTAKTTAGDIDFPADYAGQWVILFSHPADFTPVCTTEFVTFASMIDQFKALHCELIGLSIDSTYSHIAWLRTIQEKVEYKGMKNVMVTFPVIEDIRMDVARKYGMVQPNASGTQAVRAVFFIDPTAKVRALIYYPLSNGRNMEEIKRLLIAMQTSDANGVATPANWQPGEDVIVPPPGSCGAAADRVKDPGPDAYCLDWFLCFKKLPKEQIVLPPEK